MASPSPSSTRPPVPALSTKAASRKVLLRIPNAKASRWSESTQSWSFLALGDFVVYQVPSLSSSSTRSGASTPTSSTSASAPALPSRNGGAGSSSAAPPSYSRDALDAPSTTPSSASDASGIVVAVRNTEFPLTSTTNVDFRDNNTYILNNGEGFIVAIELETPRTGSHAILDNVLGRYATFNGVPPRTSTPAPTNLGVPEHTSNPSSATSSPELRPSDFKGSLLLIDEDTGKILGPLNQNVPTLEAANISSSSSQKPNEFSDENIVVTFPEGDNDGGQVKISAFDDVKSQYGKTDSRIVGAAEYVSKGILFAADYGANYTSSAAKKYTESTKATDTPLVFSQTTKNTAATVAKGTESALKLTRSAVGFIAGKAEQLGTYVANTAGDGLSKAGVAGKGGETAKGMKGFLRDGILALSTVAEGLEKGGKHFLETGRQSTNAVVGHRFGDEARDLTDTITSAGSNVVLVYVDARGVMHRALLKRVGKGALKARMKDGREVVLDDSGLENQHTERDLKGNLIVVDEKNDKDYTFTNDNDINGGNGYATGYQSALGQSSQDASQQLLKRPTPPVPPRMT